ncbi:MAG: DUF1559 domain-containing protein [Fimbriiglobus sp.]|jgi:hypothetical protein|nr:DUF1559 domain-containing protein [Fimbriiglobus sp.]
MRSLVRWSLGLTLVVFAVAAVGLIRPARPLAAQPAKKAPAVELVPVEGLAVLSVNAAKLFDGDALQPLREALLKGDKDVLKRLDADFGISIDNLDRITFFWPEGNTYDATASPAVIVSTRKPIDKAKFLRAWKASDEPKGGVFGHFGFGPGGMLGFAGNQNLGNVIPPQAVPAIEPLTPAKPANAKPKELDLNAPIYYCGTYGETVLVPIDDTTAAVLPVAACGPAFVAGLLRKKGDGTLAEALALAGQHDVVFGVSGKGLRRQIELLRLGGDVVVEELVPLCKPPVPPPGQPNGPGEPKVEDEFTPFEPLFELNRAVATLDVGPALRFSLTAHFPTSESAKKAEPVVRRGIGDLKELVTNLRKETAADPAEKDWLPLFDLALGGLKGAKVAQDGKTITASATTDVTAELKATLLTLPARIAEAADRMRLANNLKQIGLALHTYHDVNGHLPRDITDGEGKVLLSWRVHLLPYLEADDLYRKIDLAKAWDDPVNKKLWAEMPDVFKVPARPTKEQHETYLQAFHTTNWLGKDDPWQVDTHNVSFAEVTDGTSNTLAVLEMPEATHWMKPESPVFDAMKLPKIGNPKTGKAVALMLDGSVRTLDVKKHSGEKLSALITINGGEVIEDDDGK